MTTEGKLQPSAMDPEYEKRLLRQQNGSPYASPLTLSPGSPMSSPSKDKYGDRFIPARAGAAWHINFNLNTESPRQSPVQSRKGKEPFTDTGKDGLAYNCLLKNELLSAGIEDLKDQQPDERRILVPKESKNLFRYHVPRRSLDTSESSPYSLSPVGSKSQKLLRSPRKAVRKISKIPFKVLDAPELQDDFYLNLVDWSSQNVLSVGLGTCVYLWSACTSQVTRLCDLSGDGDTVTSVSWSERGNLVSVGTHKGYVQIWDVAASKKINTLEGHNARVGALAWNADMLSSGSRDRLILQRDIRTPSSSVMPERTLTGHRQEVCGLKWSPDHQHLASGGNDNKLYVWNMTSLSPVQTYTDHLAAVKAISWSPHQHGLLASGGGTADRCIRFWNTLTGQPLQCVDTGSQVCNLAWSKHSNELVSTHGYSQNQILVWKYPSLVQIAKLTGHSYRVLYLPQDEGGGLKQYSLFSIKGNTSVPRNTNHSSMKVKDMSRLVRTCTLRPYANNTASCTTVPSRQYLHCLPSPANFKAMSPDGEAIVTGAGDETLRFWNVFSKTRSTKESKSVLNLFTRIR